MLKIATRNREKSFKHVCLFQSNEFKIFIIIFFHKENYALMNKNNFMNTSKKIAKLIWKQAWIKYEKISLSSPSHQPVLCFSFMNKCFL